MKKLENFDVEIEFFSPTLPLDQNDDVRQLVVSRFYTAAALTEPKSWNARDAKLCILWRKCFNYIAQETCNNYPMFF